MGSGKIADAERCSLPAARVHIGQKRYKKPETAYIERSRVL